MAAPSQEERLELIRAGLNRVGREVRILKQQVARAIEAEATTPNSPEEDTSNDRDSRSTH